jgi:hypothetical protein
LEGKNRDNLSIKSANSFTPDNCLKNNMLLKSDYSL